MRNARRKARKRRSRRHQTRPCGELGASDLRVFLPSMPQKGFVFEVPGSHPSRLLRVGLRCEETGTSQVQRFS